MPKLAPASPFDDAPLAVEDREIDSARHLIELVGQIDLYSAPEFKERVMQVIDQGKTHVVVDLSKVTFMDSTALGVLVGARRRLRPADGSVEVVAPDERIRSLFELTGLDATFTLHETCDDAFRHIA